MFPIFFVLTTDFFEHFARDNNILQEIDFRLRFPVTSLEDIKKISETLQQLILPTYFELDWIPAFAGMTGGSAK
ncbi:MAG TPA: hypothetical protein EYG88_07995 [Desulfocapsa sulfexigens]|nr:hypothetical protein [Desulfocapsa sulfexigens]